MLNRHSFKLKPIAAAVASTMFVGLGNVAVAQDTQLEEVVVTGIRASLERAMDIKREANGVVDAIAAEDIGKFPDANLAESLQRIPGVSIDRNNGEGNAVTVRGFGPNFNTVLTNGRQMPSSADGRAFNFNDLAAELVSGVEVYKSSSAIRPSGGIGATINVTTARPLDIGEFRAAGSAKAVTDEDEGSFTPEVSGLVSTTFADGTMGVLVAASHQVRKFELERLAVDGWVRNPGFNEDELINPEVVQSGTFFMPQNYNVSLQESERTRTNANLVFQYAPSDQVTVTADYLYSELHNDNKSSQLGVWFNAGNLQDVSFNENGTAIDMYEEGTFDNIQNWNETVSENNSLGLNVEWAVTDSFNLVFDANFAESEENPGGEFNQYQGIIGYGNQQRFRIRPGSELPTIEDVYWQPDRGRAQAPFCGNGNWDSMGDGTDLQENCLAYAAANGIDPDAVATGPAEAGGIATELLRAHRNDIQHTNTVDELNQIRVEGEWLEDDLVLRAGVMLTDQSKNNRIMYNAHEPNNIVEQYAGFYGFPVISADTVARRTTIGGDFLDQFSGNEFLPPEWVYYNPDDYFADIWPAAGEGYSQIPTEWSPNSYKVEEETIATYVQLNVDTELFSMPLHVESGVRVESTDVTSTGFEQQLVELRFADPTSLTTVYAEGGATEYSEEASYDVVLPSIALKLDITEDLVGRFAASRSITRPSIANMQPTRSIGNVRPNGPFLASAGNPGLTPFQSSNVDIALEWYYDDLSYASVGYFVKYIEDFIVGGTRQDSINGVTDPSSNGGTMADPTPPAEADLAMFDITSQVNGEDARVEGLEFAVQHAFGDSGFGVGANYTMVTTNRDLDITDIDQRFAITGLSDSANLIGFYEAGPFGARLTYNWRDTFLRCFCQIQSGSDAVIVEEYGQWDFSMSYDVLDNVSLLLEGINITGEAIREHARYEEQLYQAMSTGARYAAGVRVTF